MKAMKLRHPAALDNLVAETIPAASAPGPGEIQVAIKASSLNFHDYAVVAGMIPTADGRIPLSDAAGEVLAVGSGVTPFSVGDKVISSFFPGWEDGPLESDGFQTVPGDGADGFARGEATMAANAFTLAPVGYSAIEAATLSCAGLTAWRALFTENPLKPGETVLVQGTGGVSIFALQFAKACGARVVATSSSDTKLERLRAMGADILINYRTDPDWGDTINRLTGGVDHVVEVGGPATLEQSVKACRNGGSIAVIGILTGISGNFMTASLITRQIHLFGLTVGNRRQQREMVKAIEVNGIRPVIDKVFPLDELSEAFRYQESGQHFGKICVEI